jgi:hypothetical protein
MSTGYTAIIEDKEDCTFIDYALRCARAFGACVDQRDDSLSAPPMPRQPNQYYVECVADAEVDLHKFESATSEEIERDFVTERESAKQHNEQSRVEHQHKQEAYARIRADVIKWVPPTPDHHGLKKFMLEQIDICYEPDKKPYCTKPDRISIRRWHLNRINYAKETLERCREDVKKDVERCEESRKWLTALIASLSNEP